MPLMKVMPSTGAFRWSPLHWVQRQPFGFWPAVGNNLTIRPRKMPSHSIMRNQASGIPDWPVFSQRPTAVGSAVAVASEGAASMSMSAEALVKRTFIWMISRSQDARSDRHIARAVSGHPGGHDQPRQREGAEHGGDDPGPKRH